MQLIKISSNWLYFFSNFQQHIRVNSSFLYLDYLVFSLD